MALVEKGVHQRADVPSDPGEDCRDARVGHHEPHRAGGAQVVEEPVRKAVEPERRANDGLKQHSVEQLAADRDAGGAADARRFVPRVHDGDVERASTEVDSDLDAGVALLADDRRHGLGHELDLLEARRPGRLAEPLESLGLRFLEMRAVGAGEDDGVAEHEPRGGVAGGLICLGLQALEHHADQGRHVEVDRP